MTKIINLTPHAVSLNPSYTGKRSLGPQPKLPRKSAITSLNPSYTGKRSLGVEPVVNTEDE